MTAVLPILIDRSSVEAEALSTWEDELERVSARARHATAFLADQLASLVRSECWDRVALWSTIVQVQAEFSDVFGPNRDSVLLHGRARLRDPWRLMAISDSSMVGQVAERFFAPFVQNGNPFSRALLERGIGWCLPGLFVFGFADLRVFRLSDGSVGWLCERRSESSPFAQSSGLFVVDGVGFSLADLLLNPDGLLPTIEDQHGCVLECLDVDSSALRRKVAVTQSGAIGIGGRRLAALSRSTRLDLRQIAARLCWLAWDFGVSELPREIIKP